MLQPELADQPGQAEKAERLQRADVQAAAQLGIFVQCLAGVLDGIQNTVGIFQKTLAVHGQKDPLVHAVEQAHAQLFFQCFDLYRYSGLRIAQRLCRLGETLELSRADQGIQLTNFHRRTPFFAIKAFNP